MSHLIYRPQSDTTPPARTGRPPTTRARKLRRLLMASLVAASLAPATGAENGPATAQPQPATTNRPPADLKTNTLPASAARDGNLFPTLPSRALELAECLDIALQQNAAILKSKDELEAAYGVVVQTRAVALPKLQGTGQYAYTDQLESLSVEGASVTFERQQSWNAGLRLVQSIYEGGRIKAALHTASLTKEQALQAHQVVILDALLLVRIAYYDVLLAAEQIVVEEASVKLQQRELDDTTRRYNAGTVPRFNVLRSEVALANEKPKLIQARNAYRIAKNNLAQLLGYRVPATVWEDIPLQLAGKLRADPYEIELPQALQEALQMRPELHFLRATEGLRREAVKSAKAGYLPSVQLFGGYGWRSAVFQNDLSTDIAGWNTGAQLSWNFFDGLATKGKVQEAQAQLRRSITDTDDQTRRIELDVRTSYSSFLEAKEVLESQKKTVEQAEEAVRLAVAREDAGAVTQLDVLDAQTSLTQARSTQIRALRDYSAAKARLERALGRGLPPIPR
jgi:outer membrane protein